MPRIEEDWATRTYLSLLHDALGRTAEYVERYVPVGESEVYIADATLAGLVEKTVAWAKPDCVITYRDVIMHSGSYHAFVGMKE